MLTGSQYNFIVISTQFRVSRNKNRLSAKTPCGVASVTQHCAASMCSATTATCNMAVKINMCCLHATDPLTENTIIQTHYTEIIIWITKRSRESWKIESEKRWKKLGGLQSMDSLDSKGREKGWREKEMWRNSRSKTNQGAERKSYFSQKAWIMHALPHSGAQEDGKE